MKTLFLLRHAQALAAETAADRDRRLSPQGEADAQALGQVMHRKKLTPDFIFCSPSLRTKETLAAISKDIGTPPVEYLEKIYSGGPDDIWNLILQAPESARILLVIGHNPSMQALASALVGNQEADLSRLARYAPGTLSVLECPGESWAGLQAGICTLRYFLEPFDYNAPPSPARWT